MRTDVDPGAVRAIGEHEVGDPDDRPVHRRIDVGAGRGADCERRRAGAAVAAELVPDEPVLLRPREAVPDAGEDAGVPLAADRIERQRAVARLVVPDRRHGCLRHGQLQLHRAHRRDDLRQRLASRQDVGLGEGAGCDRIRAPRAECGQQQGQQEDRRKESSQDKTSGVTLRSSPARSHALNFSGRTRPHRLPVSGRSHGRHHSRPFPIDPLATRVVGAGHNGCHPLPLYGRGWTDRTARTAMPHGGDGGGAGATDGAQGLVPAAERRNENDCGTTEGEDPQLSVCFPADKDLWLTIA